MTKEIKFRAYNKTRKAWEYFTLTNILQYPKEFEKHLFNGDTFYQYIGLHDKHGKEIYEGDLIKDTDSNYVGEVIFDEESLCFTTKFQDNDLWGFVPRRGKDSHCEIIGNIYENTELLNETH